MRFFFLRDEHRFPVACVATILTSSERDPVLHVAVSALAPSDQHEFNRQLGKDIATARLLHKPFARITVGEGWSVGLPKGPDGAFEAEAPKRHIKYTICCLIAKHSTSYRARQAALAWISNHESDTAQSCATTAKVA